MADTCSYDCSREPSELVPNADISGVGVIIGYVVSAGIVVFLVVCHYIFAFDPTINPFQQPAATSGTPNLTAFRPNAVDVLAIEIFSIIRPRHNHLQCILVMSDLQILTGMSILISGYVQLRCGISCYHWQIIVYLAWFSSLTHFACLTFLRSYLFNHPERAWRLTAMGLIVMMLTVAFVPTGNYAWFEDVSFSDSQLPIYSQAICHLVFDHRVSAPVTRLSIGFFIALLMIRYFITVVFLHEYLSRHLLSSWRKQASSWSRAKLTFWWER
ncbi:hypothetical protein K491DRAFT_611930 [Lophiostoma macrostomum CBS 122681]|uniref:Uncharacterized protein n=1 Tax=Lophiostoma macrostomum CBS 122681 TaxID=1314788 RepID=A0A6A6SMW9_9PLEO|nr:hypothetical protein K491DRAFT_611930 [Lophiostoma macrostomum CBS 122681]